MQAPRIAVMIVADHPIMRDGLRLRIQRERDMYVVCDASNVSQALDDFRRCRPDLVVIDLQWPRNAGLSAKASIRAQSPHTPLVILAGYRGKAKESLPVGQGATVIVSKLRANEQIIPAIRQAAASVKAKETGGRP
jgi:two-component system NarL family response regulator